MKKKKKGKIKTREPDIELAKVSVKRLKHNPLNPNVFDTKMFSELKKNIKRYGFLEPGVVVPRKDGTYFIVDGAHRVLAMKEMGFAKIPVIIAKGLPKSAAYSGAYSFNRIKGKLSAEKIANLLLSGVERWGEKEVKMWTGLTSDSINEYIQSIRLEDSMNRKRVDELEEEEGKVAEDIVRKELKQLESKRLDDFERTLIFSLSADDYKRVIRVLEGFGKDLNESLIRLCKKYLKLKKGIAG